MFYLWQQFLTSWWICFLQLALQKHVNNHFTSTETKENSSKRTADPPVPKQLRKNGKKLRYRRQPFSGIFQI